MLRPKNCNSLLQNYNGSTNNMVLFVEEYSSEAFSKIVEKYLNSEFVQLPAGQIENALPHKQRLH